ncbi:TPA_asm: hypothetical protein GD612_08605 [Listeria monocytogenes]|nr:hypothetical protein [Listeria monocytogenes]HAA1164995.1 hypothetical protein [Listeria monocytogenes]HAA1170833.1 hypothetical protein [Listeria monocytogenes]HAA1180985.1 hypothetical protein [Listeria monocytogenes]HAA1183303.1 hypothetical protein [Listeria monocytogenes]
MAVMEVTENKVRQREIISYITNNDLPHNELKELQRELNQLMNRNTEEKKKNFWNKTIKRFIGNKQWNDITVAEFVEIRHAGVPGDAIADYFKIARSTIFNFTQRNKEEYHRRFNTGIYHKSKEFWND